MIDTDTLPDAGDICCERIVRAQILVQLADNGLATWRDVAQALAEAHEAAEAEATR